MIDEVGYLVVDENMMKVSFKVYCQKCHHTIWKNEIVEKSAGGFNHIDCLNSLADRTPRRLNPKMEWMFAGLDKGKLKKKAKKRINAQRG